MVEKLDSEKTTKTAILLLFFNRLEPVKEVLKSISIYKPKRLYIASDGPRIHIVNEKEAVETVRTYILENISWNCDVKTLFRDQNLGCKKAVSSAIDWFFEHEEMGIILEDDCVPGESFYSFCEELLVRYKNDNRIMHISGYKYPKLGRDKYSYNFSRFTQVWGWGTWRRAWKLNDTTISLYKNKEINLLDYELFKTKKEIKWRLRILDYLLKGKIDSWAYPWNFSVRINNGLAIRPSVNLVHNIGHGKMATHTKSMDLETLNNKAQKLEIPLIHPEFVMINTVIDNQFRENYITPMNIFTRIRSKLFGK